MDYDIAEWTVRAVVGAIVGLVVHQYQRMQKMITKEEMKEYVELKTDPMIKALNENTEALKLMTSAYHQVDKTLSELKVELDHVKKINNE